MNRKQTFCWQCGKKLKLQYFSEVIDPIGNIHKIHKCCIAGAKESMRAMPYDETELTSNGIAIKDLMDHII